MNFFRALFYPFQQKNWFGELLMALAISAIPVAGYFLIKGWEFEVSRRVRHNAHRLFPGWGDLWGKLFRGVLIRLTGLLYNIPTLLLVAFTAWLWLAPILRGLWDPAAASQPIESIYRYGLGLRIGMIIVTAMVALALNSLYWAGYLRYIDTGRYEFFFDIAANFYAVITTMLDDFVMAIFLVIFNILLGLLNAAVATLLTATGFGALLAPILLPAISLSLTSAFTGYLFGEMTRDAFGAGDVPPPGHDHPHHRSYRPPDIPQFFRQVRRARRIRSRTSRRVNPSDFDDRLR